MDYVQLVFGNHARLSIYNEFEIFPNSSQVNQFVGNTITSVLDQDTATELKFLDGERIVIDMSDAAYNGPEALQLSREGEPTIIVN